MALFPLSFARHVVVGFLLLVAGTSVCAQPPWYRWMDKEVFKRIEVRGYRQVGLHLQSVTGDREAFDSTNYYGMGNRRFTDVGQINLTGRRVLGLFNFQATILDSRLSDPQGQRFSLEYERRGWQVAAGDITGQLLNTNPYASFTKTMKGVSIGYSSGRFRARALRSDARGAARTVTLQGNNSTGPYYLQASQLIIGSEQVRVDGVEKKLGTDYTVNYELGSILFTTQVVPPTSTIVVSFEALGANSRNGVVQGVGVSYDFGRFGRIGVTAMQQDVRGSTGLSNRTEYFSGFGEPSRPYVLQFEPLRTQPFVVKVNGLIQVEGVDYVFDTITPSIFYFTRFMPFESQIDVTYSPKPTSTVDGDRDTIGFDYRIPIGKEGKNGEIVFAQALGRLKSEVNPLSGTARGVRLNTKFGKYEFRAGIKDIPPGYVTVETRGFSRNERTSEASVTVQDSSRLRYTLSHQNSSISNRVTSNAGNVTFSPSRFTVVSGSASFIPAADRAPWTLEHRRTEASSGLQRTRLDSSELSMSRQWGRLDARIGIQRQSGRGQVPVNEGGTRDTAVDLNSVKLSLSYAAGSRFSLQGTTTLSQVKADGNSGPGTDITARATWTPFSAFRLTTSYSLSDSGAIATLGSFTNGFGFGFGGNGFSGGVGPVTPIGGVDARIWQVNADWQPSDRLSVQAAFAKTRTLGSITSNSDNTAMGLSITADFGSPLNISASIDRSSTTFVDSPVTSSATTFDLFMTGNLWRRWSYRAGASMLLSGGSSTFKQDSHAYEASLSYRVARRQAITFGLSLGNTRGYYPQNDLSWSLVYQYQILENLALNAGYRLRDVSNRDPNLTSGAYRSAGFDLELAFNFGR
ncbi:MAG TPA: hypothetical protein PLH94_11590 [Fimbriimonadaceae bacterium]|nr:hypothetical protein [Fimbriimonadaceae bacterium]